MSDAADLTTRLTDALDRIAEMADALTTLPGDGAGGDDMETMSSVLEAERAANEALEERVRAIMERQESVVARLEQGRAL